MVGFLSLGLSFFGAIASILGAFITYSSQARIPEATLWPLPGLILLYWSLLGIIGLLITYLSVKQNHVIWLKAAWFITGTFIPLIILGTFSIGLGVLIVELLFLIATIILTIRQRAKWLECFGLWILGAICSLLILLVMITLGNLSY
jgi:hypothetical protein